MKSSWSGSAALSVVLVGLVAGCGSSGKSTAGAGGGPVGTGGAVATGGVVGTGGTPGIGGGLATGGAVAGGGARGTGGVVGPGGALGTGGVAGTGGVVGPGGTLGTGGRATGGAAGTAGVANGGARGTGGTAGTAGGTRGTGGVLGTGGTRGSGGATGSGGARGSGGATGTGGVGTGGASGIDGGADPGIPVGHCGAQRGRYFPATSWIYTDVSDAPVRANSAATTAWLETAGGWGNGNRLQMDISFVILDGNASTQRVAPTTTDPMEYSTDCDPNVSMPVPAGGRIEGQADYICPGRTSGSPDEDCHMLVADFSSHTLFEAYQATYSQGLFYTTCTIAWDMTRDVWGAPPAPGSTLPPVATRNWGIGRQCTGPDAAGFPIAPLLFTIGDIQSGKVEHAIRFALPNNRMQRAPSSGAAYPVFVWPATHAGGPSAISPDAPIYGSRWRLKPNFDPASRGLDPANPVVKAVVYGLEHYGMLIADGGDIALMAEDSTSCTQTWDDLWGDPGSRVLNGIKPSDFDVLDTGGTDAGYDCVRNAR
jgi:serine/threonine-protein kinase